MKIILILHLFLFAEIIADNQCLRRHYNHDSVVCVCNKNYCDNIKTPTKLYKGEYVKYTSTRSGQRFYKTYGTFTNKGARNLFDIFFKPHNTIYINSSVTYQTISGFGGQFTDSTCSNLRDMNKDIQLSILRSYFSEDGLEYSMGRVPMGGTDFSPYFYTYDDVNDDFELKHFRLHEIDIKEKIPLIKLANALSKTSLQLIATPWTAPPWMKTNKGYNFAGILLKEYYQTYANYYLKFLDAYKENGIQFWAITTGNEPLNGLIFLPLPNTGWTPRAATEWLANNLGPTIRNSTFKNLKIIIHDDQRLVLPFVQEYCNDEKALQYADGIGIHWYTNKYVPAAFMKFADCKNKDLFIISTESSAGLIAYPAVALGDWSRAEDYVYDILTNFEYNAIGWMDWNLVLDLYGGPVLTGLGVDAPIIVNKTSQEFYKQPTYYAMGHFSKFLVINSVRIMTTGDRHLFANMDYMAFKRPDEGIVLIIINRNEFNYQVTVYDPNRGYFNVDIEKRSFNTFLYW